MEYILKNARVYENGNLNAADVLVRGGHIVSIGREISPNPGASVISLPNTVIFPGFVDVHVHLREPGFSYKETILTGTKACAHGGYVHVCPMPNLNPVPDSREHLKEQLDLIEKDACIHVHPFGAITVGELGGEIADLEGMAADTAGFSDDGRGVQSEDMMRSAMLRAKALGKIISAHCEDNSLLNGGYIHDGEYAKLHGHRGICSESEWGPIKRDLALVEETGCAYHVCHISTKESVALIREAKKSGIDVTCETGPHYLTLCEDDLMEHGRFKMNPPLRGREDKEALLEGLLDGTIDMIATDHAPHSAEEKGRGLEKSAMGVVGLETAFPVLYTDLVKTGILPLERLVVLMAEAPRSRFDLDSDVGFTVFDLNTPYPVNPADFLSQGKATPFEGKTVFGKCLMTVYDGQIVYRDAQGLCP